MKQLKGSLHIRSGDIVEVEVEDALSGTTFLRVSVPIADFARALMDHGDVDCVFNIHPDRVGMKYEHVTRMLNIPKSLAYVAHSDRPVVIAMVQEFLKPHEVDGWVGRTSDVLNPHNNVAKMYSDGSIDRRVTFTRFVPVEETNGG